MTDFLGDWKPAEWGIKGFNFAYDGTTTKDILDKIDEIQLLNPDLTVVLMGANDPIVGFTVEQSVNNIRSLQAKLRSFTVWGNSIASIAVSPKNQQYQSYAEATLKIPETSAFKFLNTFEIYKQFDLERFFTFKSEGNIQENIKAGDPDLQHPNQLGNAYIAKMFLEKVFGISFDPEKYIRETLAGEKYPGYK